MGAEAAGRLFSGFLLPIAAALQSENKDH